MPDKVNVVRPDGSVFSTSKEEADKLKVFGYKTETEAEQTDRLVQKQNEENRTSFTEKVKTAGEGALSGLTFGASEYLYGDEAQERAKYNPGVRVVSEIVGAIAPAVLTGGGSAGVSAGRVANTARTALAAGKVVEAVDAARGVKELSTLAKAGRALEFTPAGQVAKLGRTVEESIGGVKGAMAGGAVEGALGGVQATITNAKLNDDPVTAEALWANMGFGSLFGVAAGGVAKKLSSVKLNIVDDAVEELAPRSKTAVDEGIESFYKSLPKDKSDAVKSSLIPETLEPMEDESIYHGIREAVLDNSKQLAIADDEVKNALDEAINQNRKFEEAISAGGQAVGEAKKVARKEFDDAFQAAKQKEAADYASKLEKIKEAKISDKKVYEEQLAAWQKKLSDAESEGDINFLEKFSEAKKQANDDYIEKVQKLKEAKAKNKETYEKLLGEWKLKVEYARSEGDEALVAKLKNKKPKPPGPELYKNVIKKSDAEIKAEILAETKSKTKELVDKLKAEKPKPPAPDHYTVVTKRADDDIRNEVIASLKPNDYSDVQKAYGDLRQAINRKDVDAAKYLEKFKKEMEIVGLTSPSMSVDDVAKHVAAADEMVKLNQSLNILSQFPDSLERFRKLSPAKIEKLSAALDYVASKPEFASVIKGFDNALERIGVKVDGSVSNKAKALWQSSKPIKYAAEPLSDVQKAAQQLDPNSTRVGKKVNTPESFKNELRGGLQQAPETGIEMIVKPDVTPDKAFVDSFQPAPLEFVPDAPATKLGANHSADRYEVMANRPFWRKALRRLGGNVGSSAGRKVASFGVGSSIGYMMGGSLMDAMLGGSFATSVGGNRVSVANRIKSLVNTWAPRAGKALEVTRGKLPNLSTRIDGTEDTSSKSDLERLRDRLDEVHKTSGSFKDQVFQVTSDIMDFEPTFAKTMYDAAINARNVLEFYLPKDPGRSFSKGESLWIPSPIDVVQSAKLFNLFHRPLDVMEVMIKSKVADAFSVRVLKQMWPALYGNFQSAMIQKVVDTGMKMLSLDDQVHIAAMTGMDLHSAFSKESVISFQNFFSQQGEQERLSKNQSVAPRNLGGRPSTSNQPTPAQSLLNQ